jgi:hypothetical protein
VSAVSAAAAEVAADVSKDQLGHPKRKV